MTCNFKNICNKNICNDALDYFLKNEAQIIEKYGADCVGLVIDNNCQSNKLEDMVFWYKADMHENFKIGHPDVWQFHSQNYANNFQNNNHLVSKNRRGPVISVKKVEEDYFDDI